MTLSPYVRIVAQGKGRARALTQIEAHDAMSLILSGKAPPEAIGALLMVLRLRGETDAEIAGFTSALRATTNATTKADLDWPCYAAGRTRGAPLFLLSAKLVSMAGYEVAMHGWNSHQSTTADPRAALRALDLIGSGLSYAPLEDLNPQAFELLKLRNIFGLRSCINTVLRMWNPSGARASVQGVFHPSYRGLQSRAATLLGDQNLTVIKGGGGEFERNPAKDIQIFGQRDGIELNETAPALVSVHRRASDPTHSIEIADIWSGAQVDPFSTDTIIGTAALALWTVGAAPDIDRATGIASDLWRSRWIKTRKSA